MFDFSIVIPTYNRRNLQKIALDSVLNQTHASYAIIVVDNNSTDGTDELVKQYKDNRIRLISINNHGIIACSRNEGVKASSSDWICFLDSDDWWYPNKLEKILPLRDTVDVIYHDLDLYDGFGRPLRKRMKTRKLKSPIFNDLLTLGNGIATSGVSVKRAVLEQERGFHEANDLVGAEDYDLWVRISRRTERFQQVQEALGAYTINDSNSSRASEKQIIALKRVYERNVAFLGSLYELKNTQTAQDYFVGCLRQEMGDFQEARRLYCAAARNRNLVLAAKAVIRAVKCSLDAITSGKNNL